MRYASSSYYTLDSTRLPPDVPLSVDRTGVEGEGREWENGKLIGLFQSSVCISKWLAKKKLASKITQDLDVRCNFFQLLRFLSVSLCNLGDILGKSQDRCQWVFFVSRTTRMCCGTLVNVCRRLIWKRRNCWIKSLFLFSLYTNSITVKPLMSHGLF